MGDTSWMEPESHRLDREAMHAEHAAVAERVRRELEALEAAAEEKRRTFFGSFVDHLRPVAGDQLPRVAPADADREAAQLLVEAVRAAEEARMTSLARRTLTEAGELTSRAYAQTEREQAALAEMKAHREQLEREAEGIRAATGRIEGELAERRRQVERERETILTRARTEADGVLAAAEEERRGRLERAVEEVRAEARVEADRIDAELQEYRSLVEQETAELLAGAREEADRIKAAAWEHRTQVEREVDDLLERARAEAGSIVATTEEERDRVRTLLATALESLQASVGPPQGSLVGDLASQLPESTD